MPPENESYKIDAFIQPHVFLSFPLSFFIAREEKIKIQALQWLVRGITKFYGRLPELTAQQFVFKFVFCERQVIRKYETFFLILRALKGLEYEFFLPHRFFQLLYLLDDFYLQSNRWKGNVRHFLILYKPFTMFLEEKFSQSSFTLEYHYISWLSAMLKLLSARHSFDLIYIYDTAIGQTFRTVRPLYYTFYMRYLHEIFLVHPHRYQKNLLMVEKLRIEGYKRFWDFFGQIRIRASF